VIVFLEYLEMATEEDKTMEMAGELQMGEWLRKHGMVMVHTANTYG
jgi:hypothetical protein